LKLLLMATLVAALILLGQVEHDFVYRTF
jgi:hypothetical protein